MVVRAARASVEEIVGAVFPEDDRAFAIGFYKAWYEDEFLELKLGRGYEGLTRESFYDDAWSNFFASSAEFVGEFWLRQVAKLVVQRGFDRFVLAKAVRFSHGQFRFVVETFNRSR